jgi:hypothetical protein
MRKSIIPVLVSFLFFGCLSSGQVKVRKDDFTKKTVATVDYYSIGSTESMVSGGGYATFSFAREFDAKAETAFCTIKVSVSSLSKDIGEKGFIKVDEQTFEFPVNDRSNLAVTDINKTTTTTTTYAADDKGFVDFTKGQKSRDSDISTSKHNELGGKIILTDAFRKAVLAGKSIVVRLYNGTDPMTFQLNPEYCASLVKFYQATGNEKQ